MPTPPLSDELAKQAADAYRAAGCHATSASAAALGIPLSTYKSRLKVAAARGLLLDTSPAMPGYRISQVTNGPAGQSVQQKPEHGGQFDIPPGHIVKGVSTLVDPDGRKIVEWIKTKQGELDPLTLADIIKDAFKDFEPYAIPAAEPNAVESDLLTILPTNDWHIGMFSWGKETGTDWDLKIAEKTIGQAVDDTIDRAPASHTCVLLGGGDLAHADNARNETFAGTRQDVDGRYPKIVQTAIRLMVRTGDRALLRHGRVIFRILPGNHDPHAAIAIAYALSAWYRNDPRVIVDLDPSLFWWFRFGLCMFGATHGHTVKIVNMPSIMAHRRAEDWGATKFRYVHGFHLHHSAKFATEGAGVISEIHQAPIPQDAWHYGAGFLSGRSLQAITYHREFGEVGRVRTAILDAA